MIASQYEKNLWSYRYKVSYPEAFVRVVEF